jgi:hypothetical protein
MLQTRPHAYHDLCSTKTFLHYPHQEITCGQVHYVLIVLSNLDCAFKPARTPNPARISNQNFLHHPHQEIILRAGVAS